MKTIQIKGREYVTVSERVKYFREHYPDGRIETRIVSNNDGLIIMKAYIYDNNVLVSTGTAYEVQSSSFINKTSYIENCETSAVGRALGFLGIGIDADIASAEEVKQASQPNPARWEQLIRIEDLLQSANINPKHIDKISEEMDTYSYRRAAECIKYLLEHQVNGVKYNGGEAKQLELDKQIKEAVDNPRS
jgi:hypothetical protein